MKKVLTSIAAICCASLAATAAYAADGSIQFNGKLVDASCSVNVNGSGTSGTVQMPTVSTSSLDELGKTDGLANFTISLSGCKLGSGITAARAFFEPGASSLLNAETGNLINALGSNGAANVELRLLEADGLTQIVPGSSAQENLPHTTINAGGTTILTYAVEYYATGEATAGLVQGNVTFSLIYN